MALVYFENVDQSEQELPFLNKLPELDSLEDGEQYICKEIFRTKTGGLLVKTDFFMLYYDGKSKLAKLLLEALENYITNKGEGYIIFAVIAKKSKNRAVLAADFEKPARWQGKEGNYTLQEDGSASDWSETANPFIPTTTPKSRKHKVT